MIRVVGTICEILQVAGSRGVAATALLVLGVRALEELARTGGRFVAEDQER